MVVPGCLFVPLVADRDGHDFVEDALAAGAVAHLTHEPSLVSSGVAIRVGDTSTALLDLGSAARRSIGATGGRVVGVTGSVGKTSTKDLLAAVLTRIGTSHGSIRSFNNEIGVPLTMLNAPANVRHLVVEMGARSEGEISRLAEVARPDVAVLTTIAPAHLGEFGSLEAVARTKGEIFDRLPPNGFAVVNADVPEAITQAGRARCPVLTFGKRGEVRASEVRLDEVLRPTFRLESPWGRVEVGLAARGSHMVDNALAAAAVGCLEGVGLEDVAAGLSSASLSPWRMEVVQAEAGYIVVNDAYNANPTSTFAALEALAALPGKGRRIALLGLMAELGDDALASHAAVASRASELGVELVAVGTNLYGSEMYDDVDVALAGLQERKLGTSDAVLVKGSRVAELETLVDRLLEGPS